MAAAPTRVAKDTSGGGAAEAAAVHPDALPRARALGAPGAATRAARLGEGAR
ncbi:hypothetical protein LG943_21320 [Streptomonospora sp. S1-112]|uniref:Uncharacterized protein n=1 Tax=Streptomonospora mangrovi TaxID=2883123 RepID=A0A9X3SJ03_9ACTN|nr:hypothetical protein [Streptomonospora mangrovi]MDA0566834.1 hypothetical protein [Streptomonospora mangrovi]